MTSSLGFERNSASEKLLPTNRKAFIVCLNMSVNGKNVIKSTKEFLAVSGLLTITRKNMGNEINLLLTSKNSYTMNEFHNTQALCYYSRCQVIGRSSHLSDFQYRFVWIGPREAGQPQ